MAKRVKVVWNVDGFYQLRSAPGVVADLEARAKAVADRANEGLDKTRDGYVAGSRQGSKRPRGRWRTSVVTGDFASMLDNARNQTLLRALDAGR